MNKKTVLIIDDNAINLFALSATLKAKSFSCITKQSAPDAIELLKTDAQIDVVLIDMMMPDMDGYEAIPIIKSLENRTNLPVIAVTAQAMVGDREKCLNAGADAYVVKPISVEQLMEELSKI